MTTHLPQQIRNFSIIAHIDHGKSTLADRFIEHCGARDARNSDDQVLDSMELERERGITIKAQSVQLDYVSDSGQDYQFNLIDTPGHVDFGYEVSRALAACEGCLLVVDAVQSVQAQTIANCYQAIAENLEVMPVINKIDLPAAEPDRVKQDIEDMIGIDATDAVLVSARADIGIRDLMERIVREMPPPQGVADAPLKALIVDSWFDRYQGIVSLIRVVHGTVCKGDTVKFFRTEHSWHVEEIGVFRPKQSERERLCSGEVGYVIVGVKDISEVKVGDTLTHTKRPAKEFLPGFAKIQPLVFAGFFPTEPDGYESLKESLARLSLNDASLHYEKEVSQALGFGFRCGFLGMLHMEIVQQRLEREYALTIISTAPTVSYQILGNDGVLQEVRKPGDLPDPGKIAEIREPLVDVTIILPEQYVGSIITLCIQKRGQQRKLQYNGRHVSLEFTIPMSEVITDFFDRLKSLTRGYASFDYKPAGYQAGNLVRLDVLLNGERVDALSMIVHRRHTQHLGQELCRKMKDLIPRQMYDVAIQVAIGGRIISRSTTKALRKNVTGKCYGGDITRKRKLLDKQKAGKKRLKRIGHVEVPQEAFLAILKIESQA